MLDRIGLDLLRLGQAYATGEVTPSSLVRAIFARLADRGDDGTWLCLCSTEDVLAQAAALEAMPPNERARLPLWGVPFGIKDNIDLAGYPTTAGCPDFAYVPERSATAVARLIAAGAIPIGKTSLDQFATGLVGTRTPGTIPHNPFDPAFVCGGSSSGSALAVSNGTVSFALGTDTAGSGRVPAAFCNIVGLKPTRGRVSAAGMVPACRSLDCVSVFALTTEDTLAVLRVIEGIDGDDPYSRPVPPEAARPIGARFRFGVPDRATRMRTADDAAEAGFLTAMNRLSSLGGTEVEIGFGRFEEAAALLYGPLVAERLADLEGFLAAHAGSVHPVTRQIIMSGAAVSGAELYRAQHRLAALTAPMAALWADLDCLVVPTFPRPVRLSELEADPIGPNSMLGTYTNFVNLMDLSAVAVPAGFRPDGLPHGITLIGPAFAEGGLAGLSARFHRAVGGTLGATGARLP